MAAARLQYVGLVDARKQAIKTEVGIGMDIVRHYAAQARRGDMDEADARRRALEALASVKMNGDADFFFVIDPQMRVVMHPIRKAGTFMGDYRSKAGDYVYRELRD